MASKHIVLCWSDVTAEYHPAGIHSMSPATTLQLLQSLAMKADAAVWGRSSKNVLAIEIAASLEEC